MDAGYLERTGYVLGWKANGAIHFTVPSSSFPSQSVTLVMTPSLVRLGDTLPEIRCEGCGEHRPAVSFLKYTHELHGRTVWISASLCPDCQRPKPASFLFDDRRRLLLDVCLPINVWDRSTKRYVRPVRLGVRLMDDEQGVIRFQPYTVRHRRPAATASLF